MKRKVIIWMMLALFLISLVHMLPFTQAGGQNMSVSAQLKDGKSRLDVTIADNDGVGYAWIKGDVTYVDEDVEGATISKTYTINRAGETETYIVVASDNQATPQPGQWNIAANGTVTFQQWFTGSYQHIGERWYKMPITYAINVADLPTGITAADFETAVKNAAQTWMNVAPGLKLNFGGRVSNKYVQGDAVNVFCWEYIDGKPSTDNDLALTTPPDPAWKTVGYYWDSIEQIIEIDTRLDNGDTWSTTRETGKADLESVLVHEFGHWLAIYHVGVPFEVMYFGGKYDRIKRKLGPGDITIARQLYSSELPVADFTYTTDGLKVNFDGGKSSDTDGSVTSWRWDFTTDHTMDATGKTPTYTYSKGGTYKVTLVVQDNSGARGLTQKETTVAAGQNYTESVGGIAIPIDKSVLLAPYIGLASAIVVATVATAIYAKRVRRRKEKQ